MCGCSHVDTCLALDVLLEDQAADKLQHSTKNPAAIPATTQQVGASASACLGRPCTRCAWLTVKRCGPCRSTPPRMSAALTWPWYLQHTKHRHIRTHTAAFVLPHRDKAHQVIKHAANYKRLQH
jgi:hypothetical protein